MKLKIDGLDSLIDDLTKIENTGLLPKESIMKAGKKLESEIKKDVPKRSGTAREKIGTYTKIDTKKLKVVKVGFDDTYADWKDWKGIWFNNYGFHLWYFGMPTHKYIDKHVGWFDRSVTKNKSKMEEELLKELEGEIGKLL